MFFDSLKRGFGWGIGFGSGLLLVATVYQFFYVSDTEKAAKDIVQRMDQQKDNPRELTDEESSNVDIKVTDIAIVNGKIVMSGTISNATQLRIKTASIGIQVFHNQFLIERCVGVLNGPIEPGTTGTVSSICRETWTDVDVADLIAKPVIGQVWL